MIPMLFWKDVMNVSVNVLQWGDYSVYVKEELSQYYPHAGNMLIWNIVDIVPSESESIVYFSEDVSYMKRFNEITLSLILKSNN